MYDLDNQTPVSTTISAQTAHGDFDDTAVCLPGKFEIFTGADTHFYFHLKAENGEIIAASQGYTTKQSAERGIDAIKRIASHADVIDLS